MDIGIIISFCILGISLVRIVDCLDMSFVLVCDKKFQIHFIEDIQKNGADIRGNIIIET